MPWSSVTPIATITGIDETSTDLELIDLSAGGYAVIQLGFLNESADPTDDLEVGFFATLDGTTFDAVTYDTQRVSPGRVTGTPTLQHRSWVIHDVWKCQIRVRVIGPGGGDRTSDTYAVSGSYRTFS